jgi:hypothetical protein
MSKAVGTSKTSPNQNFVDLTDSDESAAVAVAVAGVRSQLGGGGRGGAGLSTQTQTLAPTIQTQTLSSGSVTPSHGAGFDPSEVMLTISTISTSILRFFRRVINLQTYVQLVDFRFSYFVFLPGFISRKCT